MREGDVSYKVFRSLFFSKMRFNKNTKILDAGCMDSFLMDCFVEIEKEKNRQLFSQFIGVDIDEDIIQSTTAANKERRGCFHTCDLRK